MALCVVQVVPHNDPGGMQQVARDLQDRLPSRGIPSAVLDLRRLVRGDAAPAVAGQVYRSKPGRTRAWFRLARVWKADPPDAVLAHTALGAVYALTAARMAGVPRRIVVLHGSRQTVGSLKVRVIAGLSRCGIVTDRVYVGHAAAETFGEINGRRRCVVIQNGIAVPAVPTEPPDVDPDVAQLICASRLVEGKNVQVAIRAAAQVAAPVRLHVFGDGDLRSALERLAAELNAPVTFHGHVTQAELSSWYAVGTAFLFPSLGEGLPLVLIEAAAAGVPVIASDRPFNQEVMGDAAIYCDPMDDLAWARAVDAVVSDPHISQRLRTAGRQRHANFTLDRMADEYAALLRDGP